MTTLVCCLIAGGVAFKVAEVYGAWWGIVYGTFWPIWFGYRAAEWCLQVKA